MHENNAKMYVNFSEICSDFEEIAGYCSNLPESYANISEFNYKYLIGCTKKSASDAVAELAVAAFEEAHTMTSELNITSELVEVDINRIKPDPNQPRKTFENVQGLAQTISQHGLIQPIEVDEDYQIIVGERRWRAAKIAGLKKISAIVRKCVSDSERLQLQLIEDVQDEALNPIDRAKSWEKLKNVEKLTNIELAKILGVSERHVYRILSLNNLQPAMAAALSSGRISASDLMEITGSGLPEKEKMKIFKRAIENPGRRLIRENINYISNSMKGGRTKGGIKARDFLRELGLQVDSVNKNAVVSHHKNEGMKHFIAKAMIYKILRELERDTGCEMEIGTALADMADLSRRCVYELESKVSPSVVRQKLEQFRSFNDVFIIDLNEMPDSLKDMERYLRGRIV